MLLKDSPSEAQEILNKVFWIPSLSWVVFCTTPDQLNWWVHIDMRFKVLHSVLKAYFSGQPSPLTCMEKKERKLYQAWRDYYLAIYAVIHDGWELITQSAQNMGISSLIQTPGQVLTTIIEHDATGMFFVCLPGEHFDCSTKALYDEYRLERQEQKEPLPRSKATRLKKLVTDRKKRMRKAECFTELADFCIRACLPAARKDENLKRKIKSLNACASALRKELIAILRPGNTSGFGWNDGIKTKADPNGGVFR